jgi:alkylhydroperoxidase family enzyme
MLGRSVGLSGEEMAAMAESDSSTLFDDTDRLVLRLAGSLTRDLKVSDDLYAALEARFPRAELIDLVMTVSLASFVNRVHAAFRTDVDDATRAAVGDAPSCPIGR